MPTDAEPRSACRDCGKRRPISEIVSVSRFGGGNYRVAGRYYRSSICRSCVLDYAPNAAHDRGHTNVGSLHWAGSSILLEARRFGWQGPVFNIYRWREAISASGGITSSVEGLEK